MKFLKGFYVFPEHRNKGFGKKILLSIYQEHPKIECKINAGNARMYGLVKVIHLRGEKSGIPFLRGDKKTSSLVEQL